MLSVWAKHFRNHYCLDSEIDSYRKGYNCTRSEFLNNIKFPDSSVPPGPSIRAGDFGEILVADYLEYFLQFWVPRTRYGNKAIRNESTKGSDIIGFKFVGAEESPEDTLAIFESKTQFSGTKPKPRLRNAVDDSAKDQVRKAESLNAIKQRLYEKGSYGSATRIDRFQNPADRPHSEISGAVALFEDSIFDRNHISETTTGAHPNSENLVLLVVHGEQFMNLVHNLYRIGVCRIISHNFSSFGHVISGGLMFRAGFFQSRSKTHLFYVGVFIP